MRLVQLGLSHGDGEPYLEWGLAVVGQTSETARAGKVDDEIPKLGTRDSQNLGPR